MTQDALHSSSVEQFSVMTAAYRCGLKVVSRVAVFVASMSLLGVGFDQSELIASAISYLWKQLMFAVSFGGEFWGAVIFNVIQICIYLTAACIESNLPEGFDLTKVLDALFISKVCSAVLFILGFIALLTAINSTNLLSAYAVIALTVMGGAAFLLFCRVILRISGEE